MRCHSHTLTHTPTHTHIHIHAHTNTHIHTHMHTHMHTWSLMCEKCGATHTHTHTHTHTKKNLFCFFLYCCNSPRYVSLQESITHCVKSSQSGLWTLPWICCPPPLPVWEGFSCRFKPTLAQLKVKQTQKWPVT